MRAIIPVPGDLVTLSFDPQAGHEQKGRRPALVISAQVFNRATGLAVCCPITNTYRKTPFHVPVPESTGLTGYVMCEQIKSVDFNARAIRRIGKAPDELLEEVLAVVDACLFPRPEPDAT